MTRLTECSSCGMRITGDPSRCPYCAHSDSPGTPKKAPPARGPRSQRPTRRTKKPPSVEEESRRYKAVDARAAFLMILLAIVFALSMMLSSLVE